MATTINSPRSTQVIEQQKRHSTYWIIGGFVLMAIMFYFLLSPKTPIQNTHMSKSTGVYNPSENTEFEPNNPKNVK